MLKTSILTAAAISMVSVFAQAPAFASDLSHIIDGHRGTTRVIVRDHRSSNAAKVRDHRVSKQEKVRDHRNPRNNEVVVVARKDCRIGSENLRRSGFRRIQVLDCQGRQYSYLAQRDHALYGVKMNAYSGSLKFSYIGPVRSH